jgi:hypothetical protein
MSPRLLPPVNHVTDGGNEFDKLSLVFPKAQQIRSVTVASMSKEMIDTSGRHCSKVAKNVTTQSVVRKPPSRAVHPRARCYEGLRPRALDTQPIPRLKLEDPMFSIVDRLKAIIGSRVYN